MLASIIISTYNRAEALPPTLAALARQELSPSEYEVIVIDDGSTDSTAEVLAAISAPYTLRTYRLPANSGVSAGRNQGLRHATGRFIVMISDDVIVPPDFITTHIATHERFADSWVVGGIRQLDSLTDTPFGRYLEKLENRFERARTGRQIDHDLYEMRIPTARNLSLPRADLDQIGLFDEQFRVTCEDQDLAQRGAERGIRFIYNAALECVHNDMSADLARYCRFQQLGARDTVRLCGKYPHLHGGAAIVRANSYVTRRDSIGLIGSKLAKRVLSLAPLTRGVERLIVAAEQLRLPDTVLHRSYQFAIALYTFRGFREGLLESGGRASPLVQFLRASA